MADAAVEVSARRRNLRPLVTLFMLSIIFALNNADRSLFALLLPEIRRDISMSDVMVGLLTGPAFAMIYSVSAIPIAWVSDRTSARRHIIVAGLACWSVVTLATGFATRIVHLALTRVFLGIGEATNLSPSSAMIADLFEPRVRAAAFAIVSASSSAGILIAFPLLGSLAQTHGWRMAFWLMGVVGVVAAAAAWLLVRDPAHARRAAPADDKATASFREALRFAARSRRFQLMIFVGLMISTAYSAMTAWTPTFLLRIHHATLQQTGAYLGLFRGAFGVVAALAGGGLVTWLDRFDGRWLAWAPGVLCLLIVPADLLLLLSSGEIAWKVGLALDTLFLTAAIPCTFAILMAVADPRMRATGSSLYFLGFNLIGQSLGPVAIGALNEGLHTAFGDAAIRYSLLLAPACLSLAAASLFGLSGAFKRPSV